MAYPLKATQVPTNFGTNSVPDDKAILAYLNKVMIPTCQNMLDRVNAMLSVFKFGSGPPKTTDAGNIYFDLKAGAPAILYVKQASGWMPKCYLEVAVNGASSQVVQHYFGAYPFVQAFDASGVAPSMTVNQDSKDQFTCSFGSPFTGTIVAAT